jgi:hypothetical protein
MFYMGLKSWEVECGLKTSGNDVLKEGKEWQDRECYMTSFKIRVSAVHQILNYWGDTLCRACSLG